MFDLLIHSDWSVDTHKRWMASAECHCGRWRVAAPKLVGPISEFLNHAFAAGGRGRVLLGFDFPIGLPKAYAANIGFDDFPHALAAFGEGAWSKFFIVADEVGQISRHRPFYPRVGTKGVTRESLVRALGVKEFDDLMRVCERRTEYRNAACSLFWTLGGNQVGKAAISGWRDVVQPAMLRGAGLWPFGGSLSALAAEHPVVIAETYPAEAYRMVGAGFKRLESKRRQADRASKAEAISAWAAQHGVDLAAGAKEIALDGFGSADTGEDAFDALMGLLKMIEVVDGRRDEAPSDQREGDRWEGWILGR